LVELHEHRNPGLTYRILDRFCRTHRIDAIAATPDDARLSGLQVDGDRTAFAEVVAEGRRLPQLWLRLRAAA
ncbi:hypothetical protein J8J40_35215, partial [Mycobacterium tuberculosis]|nr:hypothetical protein [Mycobacterium tuberculosis]